MKNTLPISILFLTLSFPGFGQDLPIQDRYVNGFWEAHWITHPTASANDYGVYHFRKTIVLEGKPDSFIIHVSADNRYKLYVNGTEVCLGPARGDLQHWRFESVDIASFLKSGKNVLAAVVWNAGELAPVAQISQQTAFILQGNGEKEAMVNTDKSWKVIRNEAYSPEMESKRKIRSYLVVGPGDIVEGTKYPWDWQQPDYQDEQWSEPRLLSRGQGFGRGTDGNWMLMPRQIPLMEQYVMRWAEVRRTSGIKAPDGFLAGEVPLVVPPNSTVSLLLDQGYLTTGYPEIVMSAGKGASVKISYSESLFDKDNQKGNRNEIEGKEMLGYADIFKPDGGQARVFEPLWNRTWRYVQLDIETKGQALTIVDIRAKFSGYPFEEKASFSSDLSWLEEAWEVGWRTARLCAGETYFDCPYYEQLQYVGDTRIQALISLYVTGDDRLMRRAINDFNESRLWIGLTQSRYPCAKLQVIPPYSLFWIAMVHDHWLHVGDEAYVRSLLPGVQSILAWYADHMNANGLQARTKWWHFTDWTTHWRWNPIERHGGVPAQNEAGNSSVLTFQYAYALQFAEQLYRDMGDIAQADQYAAQREALLAAIKQWCWDEEKQLFRDLPDTTIYSQHANILAVLTDAIPQEAQQALLEKTIADKDLIQASFYFKFYLFRALVKTGMADLYIDQIHPWKDMLDIGLTTFAERPEPTRSDCHAWSASPNYDLLAIVAGIMPDSPGFETVKIAPAMGDLQQVTAKMPHPNGEIKVDLKKEGAQLSALVELPKGLSGVFEWGGRMRSLNPGMNAFKL